MHSFRSLAFDTKHVVHDQEVFLVVVVVVATGVAVTGESFARESFMKDLFKFDTGAGLAVGFGSLQAAHTVCPDLFGVVHVMHVHSPAERFKKSPH